MDKKSQEPGNRPDPAAPEAASGLKMLDRRTLLRAGAAATPVLLTLASGPVSATGTSCTVASSFVSVATFKSRNPTTTSVKCTTRTCEDWYSDSCLPYSGNPCRQSYLNSTVSSCLGSTSSSYNSKELWEVLKNNSSGITTSGELGVLQHLISLCLNVMKGYAPVPGNVSQSYLQAIWQNYKANGNVYKLPASGINWDSSQVVSWARVLMYPISI